jgi:hypothetical protein
MDQEAQMETTQTRGRVRVVQGHDEGEIIGIWAADADPAAMLAAVHAHVTAENDRLKHISDDGPFRCEWSFDSTEILVHADYDVVGDPPWGTFDIREVEVQ